MEIEFDPAKEAANIAKHGLSLAEASTMDLRTAAVVADDRNAYGEVRYLAFNRIDGKPHCLVFTVRDGVIWVISFRRARERRWLAMADEPHAPFDDDSPEWTEEMFARAGPGAEVLPPEVLAAFGKPRGRPKAAATKVAVKLRLDPDVIEGFKATGPGWQTRINATLKDALAKRAG